MNHGDLVKVRGSHRLWVCLRVSKGLAAHELRHHWARAVSIRRLLVYRRAWRSIEPQEIRED